MRRGICILLVMLVLAACGDENEEKNGAETEATPTVSATLALDTGADVGLGSGGENGTGSQLPGCSDPNDDECPAPLVLDLDGTASAGGVTVQYPTRYFTAVTSDSASTGDVLIEIAPSENNRFAEKATFQIYFAESVEAALAELTDPISAEWQTETLSGTIGVVKDQTQEPPVNTSIGAFEVGDGRVIVLKAITTGKYGWDLHARLYEDMLNSLAVSE
jgi:hypothetical protein